MPIHYKNNIGFFTFPLLDEMNVTHGIFMRHGGCSPDPWTSLNTATSVGDSRDDVIENRKRITDCLNLKKDSVFDVWQVHSNHVIYSDIPRNLNEPHRKADAIITQSPQVSLMMLFADCVPILLFDHLKRIVAIAHAGWKGTVENTVGATINSMKGLFSSDPKNIFACIGPSICVTHYEVGHEVSNEVKSKFQDYSQVLRTGNGKAFFDLQMANKINLKKSGVNHIHDAGICTACDPENWYSHRAENGKTGRFAAVISPTK